MKRKRFTEEQIIGVLKESEAGAQTGDICRRPGTSSATFCSWRKTYGGMEAGDAKGLKALEAENARLKRIVADQRLDMSATKDLLQKHREAHGEATSCGLSDDRAWVQRAARVPDRGGKACRRKPEALGFR